MADRRNKNVNYGSTPKIKFNFSAYDAEGLIIATNSDLETIPAGATVPIFATLDVGDQEIDELEITVGKEELQPQSRYPNYNYVIEQNNLADDKIVGIIANEGEDTTSFLSVAVVAYDEAGNIIGGDSTYADDNGPGTSAPFSIRTYTFADDMADYELYILPSTY